MTGARTRLEVGALGTKAEVLERLAPLLRSARVLPQLRFTTGDWRTDPRAVVERIRARGWLEIRVIVRSSALDEDAPQSSLAGRFRSVSGRLGESAVRSAVDEVVSSMGASDTNQVFVQPELRDVGLSGVVLTRDPANGSHYYVVGYDDSGRTDGITSGRVEDHKTYYHHADSPGPPEARLVSVLALARELEELLVAGEVQALDIEFATTTDGALYLLQVRPLRVPGDSTLGRAGEARALARVRERVEALGGPHPYLLGTRAVFGTMPDWNPAEVIGVRPKPLALSLYRELITDSIWAYQRSNYGYRNLRSFPLLVSLGGLPYVDVRVSFNSFVPADLDADLGRRLVDDYTARLLESPQGHDKVEFAIVYSCYTLDLPQRLERLLERGFDRTDCARIAASLRALTNRISAEPTGLFRRDVEKVRELERRQELLDGDPRGLDPVSRIYWLLEDCKRYGTLPFAGIARAAFIAVQFLDSLVAVGILSTEERERFLRSLHTVRARMSADLARLPRAAFLREYGHLRPGTYDVTSPRYDETPETYFDWTTPAPAEDGARGAPLELSAGQRRRIDGLLAEHGLAHDHRSLLAFVQAAIEEREYAKFVFSRSLSAALVRLADFAAQHGFSREDLAFADIEVVRRLYADSAEPGAALDASIQSGKRRFEITRQITLPPLVTAPSEAFSFRLPACEPNYVTLKSTVGPVVTDVRGGALRGAIVLIPSADPGYDWIFSSAIAGLITMYGGYNSHMAIRANELGIPAVIGAGESLFRAWAAARRLRVDCLNHRVEVLA